MVKYTKKEKLMFWAGILIVIGSGILSNLLVGSSFDIKDNGYNIWNTLIFIITTILFILLLWYIMGKLKNFNKK